MVQIKAINIHAFRGIPDLELRFDGKNLALKGENATGKSSIVEAFEFFFTGNLSIFAGEGTQSLSLIRHTPHKNFKKDDVSVKVTFDPGEITLVRTFDSAPTPPALIKDYFQAAQKGTFILHRSQILGFINSPPADRFRAITTIIGGERLDDVELAMKRAYEELRNSASYKEERLGDIFSSVSQELGKHVTNPKQALDLMNQKLKENGLTELTSFAEISKVSEEFMKSLKETTDFEHIAKLSETIELLDDFEAEDGVSKDLQSLNERIRPFLEEKSKRELLLREFLTKGQQAVEIEQANSCPLCGQEIDREKLLQQITQRLQTLRALSDEAAEVRRLASDIDFKLVSLDENVEEVCSKIEPIKSLERLKGNLEKTLKFLKKFREKMKLAKELELDEELSVEPYRDFQTAIEHLVGSALKKCKQIFKKIGVSADWKKKMETITLANRVETLLREATNIDKDLYKEKQKRDIAQKVFETFSETKKTKIAQIYDAIKGNVNAYYSVLHPNEPHRNIELSVSSKRRASTELKMESFGSIEDPRAFSSEGHLDSLGLCVFLGFVKKFNEKCNFIVLDDVMTTIDSQHRNRVCELLYEQFKNYQLLITTHDEIWYNELCGHQRAYGIDGNCRNMEISSWSLETGPVIQPYKPRWERIEDKIKAGDKIGASIEGRLYLEWLLKTICLTMMARPIFKVEKYMVADLLGPAEARIGDFKDTPFKKTAQKRFQDLEANSLMANFMAHDNLEAENASAKEVSDFCNAVHNLHLAFCCPDCKSFLKYYPDMKRIRCPNSHCKQQVDIAC
jgi:recombinational DNA repair ATPase RecF